MIKLGSPHRLIDVIINAAFAISLLLMVLVASALDNEINILRSVVNEIRDIQDQQQLTSCVKEDIKK